MKEVSDDMNGEDYDDIDENGNPTNNKNNNNDPWLLRVNLDNSPEAMNQHNYGNG